MLLRSVAQECRSDMCVEMLPELSLRSVAQKRRLRACVCVCKVLNVSFEVLFRSVAYVCVEVSLSLP